MTNELTNLIFGFIFTEGNNGIILYSSMQLNEFVISRELFLAKATLNLTTSRIDILESALFDSDTLIKQMHHGGCEKDRFVLLSERSKTLENSLSTFYIFSTNDISKPIKKLTVSRVNDKILFYHLIGNSIYFFDTQQVGLFEDVLFNKSLIRKLCIKTGEVTSLKTSTFPECGNYIAYGNVSHEHYFLIVCLCVF